VQKVETPVQKVETPVQKVETLFHDWSKEQTKS
jgi:hypothetical protein